MPTGSDQISEYVAVGKTPEGVAFKASINRLSQFYAVIEVYDPAIVLRASQVIPEFTVFWGDSIVYSGRGTVAGMITSGMTLVGEIKLSEAGFVKGFLLPVGGAGTGGNGFQVFLQQWQKAYHILPDFKIVVADMQMFLRDFGRWMDQLELDFNRRQPTAAPPTARDYIREISGEMAESFNALHEQFEAVGNRIEADARPAHADFVKRQLHPLVMCSPFAHRTYQKPLGYAGDYEMVNMILREPLEGNSFYAQALNGWFLRQWPAEAHRNRIQYLVDRLAEEALRGERRKRPIRVLNLGCGPAHEIARFLTESELADHTEFTLWDFNDETVERTGRILEACRKKHGRNTKIQITQKSVQQVLKEGHRWGGKINPPEYDYIYCAGLFDYLTDKVCKQIMNVFYDWLAPGGLLAITNVVACKPFRHMLEFLLDWHLIYRDTAQGRELIPAAANPEECRIFRDATEVNLMVEVRKPAHA